MFVCLRKCNFVTVPRAPQGGIRDTYNTRISVKSPEATQLLKIKNWTETYTHSISVYENHRLMRGNFPARYESMKVHAGFADSTSGSRRQCETYAQRQYRSPDTNFDTQECLRAQTIERSREDDARLFHKTDPSFLKSERLCGNSRPLIRVSKNAQFDTTVGRWSATGNRL